MSVALAVLRTSRGMGSGLFSRRPVGLFYRVIVRCLGLSLFVAISSAVGKTSHTDLVLFDRDIAPVLQKKCYQCHGPKKSKGDFRLDSPEAILRGGENGSVLEAGDPLRSSIYYSTTYPEDDPDFMPQKGDGLTESEKNSLKTWIEQGAVFEGHRDLASVVGVAVEEESAMANDRAPAQLDARLGENASIISSLRNSGVIVDTANNDVTKLELKYTYVKARAGEFDFALLETISDRVDRLDFSRSGLGDSDIQKLDIFRNLRYLDLSQTGVTDEGVSQLTPISILELLNLRSTGVSDRGLMALKAFSGLRRLYVWDTNVSANGISALEKKIPNTEVISGLK